jgi:class 3 adenylate cyclase
VAAERKVVTVLFTDVTGSTQLADSLDPEDLREVMDEWFAAVRGEIEAQGGTVEKYIGDAVMAVFGVPTAHEDDPARALRAALAIRERLAEVNDRLGLELEIRTGVNTGAAVATPQAAPGEPLVTGVAVNAAARLEQLAEPGQTVVAERTARAAPGFLFEDLGPQQLRGKEEAVRAYLLVGADAQADVRGLPGMHAPLVGRDRELDLLLSLQERVVAERRPHLVTVYGDPGVGKSRLVRELLARLRDGSDPPRIVVGRCLSYGDGITYWPFAEILKTLSGVNDDDSADAAVTRIAALVDHALGSSAGELVVPALAFTLGLETGKAAFERLDPSGVRIELQRAWRALLSAVAEREPLVVVVDDIHWADGVLLDLLEELADRAQGPLFFVCPARPELTGSRPTWGGGKRSFSSVFVSPLGEADARRLVAQLLDVDGLRDDTRAQILERAEGNPFFLEEILRQLIDDGRIARRDGRWTVTAEFDQLDLPDTVQGVLSARIDLLQPREKRTLQHASVVGRIFWRGAVAVLVDDHDTLDPDLRRLEERELVASRVSSSLVGEEELSFRHILTRDVAYESLPRRERPHAHARVARWIEETTGDRQREYAALLAHHYTEAYRGASSDRSFPGDELEALRRRAFDLLIQASRRSMRGAAYRAARALAQNALDVAVDADEQATALEALGQIHHHAAFGDEGWAAYLRAVDVLREAGSTDHERIGRLTGLALERPSRWAGTMRSRVDEGLAQRYLDSALEHLPPGDSEASVRLATTQAFWWHGWADTPSPFSDPQLSERVAAEAAEAAIRIERPDLAVAALDAVQHNLQRQLRYADAWQSARRRLELALTAGNLGELGDSYAVACWNGVWLGVFEEARAIGRDGHERLRVDAPLFAVHALSWAALGSFFLGDWDALFDEFALVSEGLGERLEALTSGFATPWPAVAFAREARGDRAGSDEILAVLYELERARGVAASTHLSALVIQTLVLRGELEPARARLHDALGREILPLLKLAEADLVLAEGGRDAATRLVRELRELAARSGALYLEPAALRLEGRYVESAGAYDGIGMAVHAAVARLDAVEHSGADTSLLAAARGPLERAGFRRELGRLDRLER